MKKRILSAVLAAVLLALCAAATGCGDVRDNGDDTASPGTQNDNYSIKAAKLCAPEYPAAVSYDDYDAKITLRESNPVSRSFEDSVTSFAGLTFAGLYSEGENIVYSPLSLYYALAVLATGASGETANELNSLLGVNGAGELRQQCGNLYRLIYTDNSCGKLKIANSIWADNSRGVSFKKSWLESAASDLYASVFSADFSGTDTGRDITQWVHDATDGFIEYDYQPDPEQVMAIINTVYYYDQWDELFNEANNTAGKFHCTDATDADCEFMNRTEQGTFYTAQSYDMASLTLKNGGAVTFVLPKDGVPLAELVGDAQVYSRAAGYAEMNDDSHFGEITWSVPKFSCENELDISGMLSRCGVTRIFSDTHGFGYMTDDDMYVSDIKQKARIAVNEKGIEAAAYTEIALCGAGMPSERCEMILNRPFMYVISFGGVPLFVGAVNEM